MSGSSVELKDGSREYGATGSSESVNVRSEGVDRPVLAGSELFTLFRGRGTEAYRNVRDTLLKLQAGQEVTVESLAELFEFRGFREPLKPVVTDALLHVAAVGGGVTERLAGVVLSKIRESEGRLDPFLQELLVRATVSLSVDSAPLHMIDTWLARRVSTCIEQRDLDSLGSCRLLLQRAFRENESESLFLPKSRHVFQKALEKPGQSTLTSLLLGGYDWLCRQDSRDNVVFAAMVAGSAVGLSISCLLSTSIGSTPVGATLSALGALGGIISSFIAMHWLEKVHYLTACSESYRHELAQLLEA